MMEIPADAREPRKNVDESNLEIVSGNGLPEHHLLAPKGGYTKKAPVCTTEKARDRNFNIGIKDRQKCLVSTMMQTDGGDKSSALKQNEVEETSIHPLKIKHDTGNTRNSFVSTPTIECLERVLQVEGSASRRVQQDIEKEGTVKVAFPAVTRGALEPASCTDMIEISSNVTAIADNTMCRKDTVSTDNIPQKEELSNAIEVSTSSGSSKFIKENLVVKESHKKSFAADLLDKIRKATKHVLLEQMTSKNEAEKDNDSNKTKPDSVLCKVNDPLNGKEKSANFQNALTSANTTEEALENCQSVTTGVSPEENAYMMKTAKKMCGEDLPGGDTVWRETNKMKGYSTQDNTDLREEGAKASKVYPQSIICDIDGNCEKICNMEDTEGGKNVKGSCSMKKNLHLDIKIINDIPNAEAMITELVTDMSDSTSEKTECNFVTSDHVDKNNEGKIDKRNDTCKEKYDNIFDKIRGENEIVREQEAMEIAASLFFEHTGEDAGDNPASDFGMRAHDSNERSEENAKWMAEDHCNNIIGDGSDTDVISPKEPNNKAPSSGLSSSLTAAQRLIEKFNLNIGKGVSDASSDTKKQKRMRELPANKGYDKKTESRSQNCSSDTRGEGKRAKLMTDSFDQTNHEIAQQKKSVGNGTKTLAPKARLRLPPQLMDIGNSGKVGRRNKIFRSAGKQRETDASKEISNSKKPAAREFISSNMTQSSHSFTAIRQPLDKMGLVDTQGARGEIRLDSPIMKGIGTEVKESKTARKKHEEPLQSSDASKKVATFKVCVKIMCAEKASYIKQTDRGPVNVVDKSVQIITVKKRVLPDNSTEKCAVPLPGHRSATAGHCTYRCKSESEVKGNKIPQFKQLVKIKETGKDKKRSDLLKRGENDAKNESINSLSDDEVEIIDAPGISKKIAPSVNTLPRAASNVKMGNTDRIIDALVTSRSTAQKTSTGTSTTMGLHTAISGVPSGHKQSIIDLTTQDPKFSILSNHITSKAPDPAQVSQIHAGLPKVISVHGCMGGSSVNTLPSSSDFIQVSMGSSTRTDKSNIFPKIVGFCSLAQLKNTERLNINKSKEVELHIQRGNNHTAGISPVSSAEGLKIVQTLSHVPSLTEKSNEISLEKNFSPCKESDTTASSSGPSSVLGSQNIQCSVIVSGTERILPTTHVAVNGQLPNTTGHTTLPVIVSSSIMSKSNQKTSLTNGGNNCLQQDTMPITQTNTISSRKDIDVSGQQLIPVPMQQTIPFSRQQRTPASVQQGTCAPTQQATSISIQQATSISIQQAFPTTMQQGTQTLTQQGGSLPQGFNQVLQGVSGTKQQGNPLPRLEVPTTSWPTPDLAPIPQSVENSSYQKVILVQDNEGKYALMPVVVHMNRNMPNTAQSIQQDPMSQPPGSQLPSQLNVPPELPSSLTSSHSFSPLVAPKSIMPALESTRSKLRASAASTGIPLLAPINMPKLTRAHSPAFVDNVLKIKTVNGTPGSRNPTPADNLNLNTQPGSLQSINLTNSSAINTCILAMNDRIGKVGRVNCLTSSQNSSIVNTKSTTTGVTASNAIFRQIAPRVVDVKSSGKTPGHRLSSAEEKSSGTVTTASGKSPASSTHKHSLLDAHKKVSTFRSNTDVLSTAKAVVSKEVYDTSPFWLKQASKVRLLDQARCKLESPVFGKLSEQAHITGQGKDRCHKGSSLRYVKQIITKYSNPNKRECTMKFGVFENQFVMVNDNRQTHSFLPAFQDAQFIQNLGLECVVEALNNFEKALEDVLHSCERDQWEFGDFKGPPERRKMRISMKRKLKEMNEGGNKLQDVKKMKLVKSEEETVVQKKERMSFDSDSEMNTSGDINKNKKQTIVNNVRVEKEAQEIIDDLEIVMKVKSEKTAEESKSKILPAEANVKTKCVNPKGQMKSSKGSVKLTLDDSKESDRKFFVKEDSSLNNTGTSFNANRSVVEKKKGVDPSTKRTRSINGFKVRELFVGVENILL